MVAGGQDAIPQTYVGLLPMNVGFSNHLYYFPHLPVANVKPIYPQFPTVTHVPKSTLPPELEEELKIMFYSWIMDTDVYGSRNLYNLASWRAFVSNYFAQHLPDIEDVQLHSGFANAVYKTYHEMMPQVGMY